jgi:hypothetical protein
MTAPQRDERGSIVIALMAIFVATGLIVGTTLLIENYLKTSRRYGDSANALQLADAAVNDAVKDIGSAFGTTIGPVTKTLGTAGSYTYTASLDPVEDMWHIDASGADTTGVTRHVKAEAVAQPLFGNAFFVDAGLALPSGIAMDSYTDGLTLQNTCTRHGTLGTNDPANLTFNASGGSGNGQQNCTDAVHYGGSNAFQHPTDGCVAYHDTDQPEVFPPNVGQANHCPPVPWTRTDDPKYPIPSIVAATGTTWVNQSSNAGNATQSWPQVPCDATHPIQGGTRYYVSQVTLLPGCRVNATNGPAIIYTTGSVNIGIQNGGSSSNRNLGMNSPDTSNPLLCPNYTGTDWLNTPRNLYCPGWVGNLQIYMTDGNTNNVKFGNNARFWGVIMGQNSKISTAPQVEMWGAVRVAGLASSAQMTLHYDEALGKITTGVYSVVNWREEPQ